MQKLLTFSQQKLAVCVAYNNWKFIILLTSSVVSFEQLGPVVLPVHQEVQVV